MKRRWVSGASFPINGSKNSRVETKAIQESDGTWTAHVGQTVKGTIVNGALLFGFATLFKALRRANEVALALAEEKSYERSQNETSSANQSQGVYGSSVQGVNSNFR
jgi:hypothetical protein